MSRDIEWSDPFGKYLAKKEYEKMVKEIKKEKIMEKEEVVAAKLTFEEVVALRAYTDAFYVVINQFLQKLYTADRMQFLTKEKTWSSTIRHTCSAFYKLGNCKQLIEKD